MHFSFMTFSTPELALPALLETAKRFGYEAVEPRLDSKHAHGIEVAATAAQRGEIRKALATAGIGVALVVALGAGRLLRRAAIRE